MISCKNPAVLIDIKSTHPASGQMKRVGFSSEIVCKFLMAMASSAVSLHSVKRIPSKRQRQPRGKHTGLVCGKGRSAVGRKGTEQESGGFERIHGKIGRKLGFLRAGLAVFIEKADASEGFDIDNRAALGKRRDAAFELHEGVCHSVKAADVEA